MSLLARIVSVTEPPAGPPGRPSKDINWEIVEDGVVVRSGSFGETPPFGRNKITNSLWGVLGKFKKEKREKEVGNPVGIEVQG